MTTELIRNNMRYVFSAEYAVDGDNITNDAVVRVGKFDVETGKLIDADAASVPKPVMTCLTQLMSRMDEYDARVRSYSISKKVDDSPDMTRYKNQTLKATNNALDAYINLALFIVKFGLSMRGMLDGIFKEPDAFYMKEIAGIMKAYITALEG